MHSCLWSLKFPWNTFIKITMKFTIRWANMATQLHAWNVCVSIRSQIMMNLISFQEWHIPDWMFYSRLGAAVSNTARLQQLHSYTRNMNEWGNVCFWMIIWALSEWAMFQHVYEHDECIFIIDSMIFPASIGLEKPTGSMNSMSRKIELNWSNSDHNVYTYLLTAYNVSTSKMYPVYWIFLSSLWFYVSCLVSIF